MYTHMDTYRHLYCANIQEDACTRTYMSARSQNYYEHLRTKQYRPTYECACMPTHALLHAHTRTHTHTFSLSHSCKNLNTHTHAYLNFNLLLFRL